MFSRINRIVTEWSVNQHGYAWLTGASALDRAPLGSGASVADDSVAATGGGGSVEHAPQQSSIPNLPQLATGEVDARQHSADSRYGPLGTAGSLMTEEMIEDGQSAGGPPRQVLPFVATPGTAGTIPTRPMFSSGSVGQTKQGGWRSSTGHPMTPTPGPFAAGHAGRAWESRGGTHQPSTAGSSAYPSTSGMSGLPHGLDVKEELRRLQGRIQYLEAELRQERATSAAATDRIRSLEGELAAASARAHAAQTALDAGGDASMAVERVAQLAHALQQAESRLGELRSSADNRVKNVTESLQEYHRRELRYLKDKFDQVDSDAAVARSQLAATQQRLQETQENEGIASVRGDRATAEVAKLTEQMRVLAAQRGPSQGGSGPDVELLHAQIRQYQDQLYHLQARLEAEARAKSQIRAMLDEQHEASSKQERRLRAALADAERAAEEAVSMAGAAYGGFTVLGRGPDALSSPGMPRPSTRGGGSSRPPTRSAVAAEAKLSVYHAEQGAEAARRELRRLRDQFEEQELQLQDLRRSEAAVRSSLESEAPLRAALQEELRMIRAELAVSRYQNGTAAEEGRMRSAGSETLDQDAPAGSAMRSASSSRQGDEVDSIGAQSALVRRLEQELTMVRSRLEAEAANGVQQQEHIQSLHDRIRTVQEEAELQVEQAKAALRKSHSIALEELREQLAEKAEADMLEAKHAWDRAKTRLDEATREAAARYERDIAEVYQEKARLLSDAYSQISQLEEQLRTLAAQDMPAENAYQAESAAELSSQLRALREQIAQEQRARASARASASEALASIAKETETVRVQLEERVVVERRRFGDLADRRAKGEIDRLRDALSELSKQVQEGEAAQDALGQAQEDLHRTRQELDQCREELKEQRQDRERERAETGAKHHHEVQQAAARAVSENDRDLVERVDMQLQRWKDGAKSVVSGALMKATEAASDESGQTAEAAAEAAATQALSNLNTQWMQEAQQYLVSAKKDFLEQLDFKERQLQAALGEIRARASESHVRSLKAAQAARSEEYTRQRQKLTRLARKLRNDGSRRVLEAERAAEQLWSARLLEMRQRLEESTEQRVRLLTQQLQQTHRLASYAAEAKVRSQLEKKYRAEQQQLGGAAVPITPVTPVRGVGFAPGSPAPTTPGAAAIARLRSRAERAEKELDRAVETHRKEMEQLRRSSASDARAMQSKVKAAERYFREEQRALVALQATIEERITAAIAKAREEHEGYTKQQQDAADAVLQQATARFKQQLEAAVVRVRDEAISSNHMVAAEAVANSRRRWMEEFRKACQACQSLDMAEATYHQVIETVEAAMYEESDYPGEAPVLKLDAASATEADKFSERLAAAQYKLEEAEAAAAVAKVEASRIAAASAEKARLEAEERSASKIQAVGAEHEQRLSELRVEIETKARAAADKRIAEITEQHKDASNQLMQEAEAYVAQVGKAKKQSDGDFSLDKGRDADEVLALTTEVEQLKVQLREAERQADEAAAAARSESWAESAKLKQEMAALKEKESQALQQLWRAEEQARRAVEEARYEEEAKRRQAVDEVEADLRAKLETALAESEQGADIIASLMRESEEQARRLGEMRGALEAAERAKERETVQQEQQLKTQAKRMQTEFDRKQRSLKQDLESQVKAARDALSTARDEWSEERSRIVREAQQEKQMLLSKVAESDKSSTEAVKAELEKQEELRTRQIRAEHASAMASLKATHEAQMDDARKQADNDRKTAFDALRERLREQADDDMRKAMDDAESRHRDRVRELEQAVRQELDSAQADARKAREDAIRQLESTHESAVAELREESRRKEEALQAEVDRTRKETDARIQERLSEADAQHAAELASLEEKFRLAIESAKERAETDAKQRVYKAVAEALAENQKQLEGASGALVKAAEEAKQKLADEVEADLRAKLETALAESEQGADIIASLMRESEEQARRLGEMRGALEAAERAKERETVQQEQQLKTQAKRMQTEFDRKQRSLKQDLESQVKAARDALSTARDEWSEERSRIVREAQQEKQLVLRLAEESGRNSSEAARRDVKAELEKQEELRTRQMRAEHASAMASLKAAHEAYMDDARKQADNDRKTAFDALRERLREQADDDMRKAMDDAESRHRDRVRELEQAVRQELDSAQADARKAREDAIRQLESAHESAMADLREESRRKEEALQAEVDRVKQSAAGEHAEELAALKQRFQYVIESAMERQDKEAKQKIEDAVSQALQEHEKLREGEQGAVKQQHAEAVQYLELETARANEAEAAAKQAQRRHDREIHDLQLQVERARMILEDNLGKLRQLDPEAIERRVEASLQAAEEEVTTAIAKAQQAAQEQLQEERDQMQEKSAKQAEMVTGMRQEWMSEKDGLVRQLQEARAAHSKAVKELEAARMETASAVEAEQSRQYDHVERAVSVARARHEEASAKALEAAAKQAEEAAEELVAREKAKWDTRKAVEVKKLKDEFELSVREYENEARRMQHAQVEVLEQKHKAAVEAAFKQAMEARDEAIRKVLDEKAEAVRAVERQAVEDAHAAQEQAKQALLEATQEAATRLEDALRQAERQRESDVSAAVEEARQVGEQALQDARREWDERMERALQQKDEESMAAIVEIQEAARGLTEENARALEIQQMRIEEQRTRLVSAHDAEMDRKLNHLADEAEAEKVSALEAFNEEWTSRLAGREDELQREKDLALARSRSQFDAEMQQALEDADRRAREVLESRLQEAADDAHYKQQYLQERAEARLQEALDKAQQELEESLALADEQKQAAIDDARVQASDERRAAVEALRKQAAKEQEQAMEELRDESEKLLGSIESAMNKLREERDLVEEDLAEARAYVQQAEDRELVLRQQITGYQNAGRYQKLYVAFLVARYIYSARNIREDMEGRMQRLKEEMGRRWRERLELVEEDLNLYKDRLKNVLGMKDGFREALMSHKRELLIEHKMSSATAQKALAELTERKQDLQRYHAKMSRAMSEMEGGVRALEKEMQELAKQSVIYDGKINVTLARKKKRVDRDLDNMLVRINDHRSLVQDIERDMNATEDERVEKEEELKFIEGQLVTTMIQYQRNLMKILNECRVGDEDEFEKAQPKRGGVRFAGDANDLGDGEEDEGDEARHEVQQEGGYYDEEEHYAYGDGSLPSTMKSGISVAGVGATGHDADQDWEHKSAEDDGVVDAGGIQPHPSVEDGDFPEGPGSELGTSQAMSASGVARSGIGF